MQMQLSVSSEREKVRNEMLYAHQRGLATREELNSVLRKKADLVLQGWRHELQSRRQKYKEEERSCLSAKYLV